MTAKTRAPHVLYLRIDEVERVVRRFDDCTLPCGEWTHEAHLTVGLWYIREYPADEALDRLRSAIQRYNATCGSSNGPGYHETITRFYLQLIRDFLLETPDQTDWVTVTNRLLASDRVGVQALGRYYSRERLMSAEARQGWVPPDRQAWD